MMSERWFADILEENSLILICNIMREFVWIHLEESRKVTVKLLGVRSEIWFGHLADKRQKCYRLNQRDRQNSR